MSNSIESIIEDFLSVTNMNSARKREMMSSVGLSGRGIPIGGAGGIGGGDAAAATTRRSYHCYECTRTVAIVATDELVCPLCYGAFLEERDGTNPSPSSPLTTAFGSLTLYDYFPSFASAYASDSDDDIELTCPPPPPPPPPLPLPPFTTADDATFYDFHNDITESTNHLPPPPLPQPPRPPLPSNLRTTAIISGLTIDLSETLDNYFTNLPLPPPPPPLPLYTSNSNAATTSNRRTHRLPTPPLPPAPHSRAFHLLPLPPARPPPATTLASVASSSSREIQLPYPLPPPQLSSPPHWDYAFPGQRDYGSDDRLQEEDPDDLYPDRFGVAGVVSEVVEDEFIFDRKMTQELMSSEESSQCAVCLENLELNEIVKLMPCKHIFHSNCIVTWLDSHPTCPVCRFKLPLGLHHRFLNG